MKNNTLCCIQARMGSKRLPKKVMADICGKPLIQHLIERLKRCNEFDFIILLTSVNKENDILEDFVKNHLGIKVYRGSEDDVLSRFVYAQKEYNPDHIIRICADSPLTDPVEVDKIIKHHFISGADYSFNNIPALNNNYPDGVGGQIFKSSATIKSGLYGLSADDKEHADNYVLTHPEQFKIETIKAPKEIAYPDIRVDVDTEEDLQYVRKIVANFTDNTFNTLDIINFLTK